MTHLELILTEFYHNGGAVFLDVNSRAKYVMYGENDQLHKFEESDHTERKRDIIGMVSSGRKRIFMERESFGSMNEASDYLRALHSFDRMVEYVIGIYSGKDGAFELNIPRKMADAGLQESRDKMIHKGYIFLLEQILKDRPDLFRYIDAPPEEIITHLRELTTV